MYILGISCFYHDSAAVLIKDGILIAASEEERFSRIKHDSSFPHLAIEFCLKSCNISMNDIIYVVFYEKPFLKFERILQTSLIHIPKSGTFFRESMKEWFFDKLWIKSFILTKLHITEDKLLFCEHHLSHMASSFFCSGLSKSAVLSIDGVGEWTTASWGIGEGETITVKEELHFPNSLGLLYSAFTVFAGFKANDGEYKLMGLAPYGKPIYVEKIKKIINIAENGSFLLNQEYFSFTYDINGIYTKRFIELFGAANNTPDKIIEYYADIAASIQFVTEEILIKIVSHVIKKSGLYSLCYAGGVALNSKANWNIKKHTSLKNFYIQPSAGDAGGALGAALWVYHTILRKKQTFIMNHAYYGQDLTDEEIVSDLLYANITYKKISDKGSLIDYVSDKIVKKQVVGWVQGKFEWGPRALGNRSILADPRSFEMKELVNKKIKFREGFRPFAPSVNREFASKIFAIDNEEFQLPFNFMLYVVPVKKKHQPNLGAITHVDGTARPQIVDKKSNPLYHELIDAFRTKTGTPLLLNTSFNLNGEPIVNTTKQALNTFYKSGLDVLVIDKYIVEKK